MLKNNRGIAMILTLWILAALIVLAAGLAVTARTEAQISRNFADIVRCRWAARAGENRGIVEVESLRKQPQTYMEEGKLTLSSQGDDIDLADTSFDVSIEDEAGKININNASRKVLEAFFGSREIADCIADWRDKDDMPKPLGAESQYYAGLQTPYQAKNGPFDTVEELLLVKGVTKELLSTPVSADGRSLGEMITVYSRDQNVTIDGKDRTNIRTAGKGKIKSALGDILSDKDIDAIIKQRDKKKFKTAGEIVQVPGLSRDKAQKIYDRLTASDAKRLTGRVNINTAPVEVLAALPGMDKGIAEEIAAYRSSRGAFTDVGQLLTVTGVTPRAFAKSADLLTVRSRVFRITSTGRLVQERSAKSIVCVADATQGQTAQIRYWQE